MFFRSNVIIFVIQTAERLIQSGVESGWERNHGEEGRENRSSGSQVEQRMSVKQDSLILSNSELDVLSLSSDLEKRGKVSPMYSTQTVLLAL